MTDFTLTEAPDRDLVLLQARRFGAGANVLHLGAEEWWLVLPAGGALAAIADLATHFAGAPHSAVDISDRHLPFILEGADAATVLSAFTPLDLASFPVGAATRTAFAKATAMLWRQAETRYHLEVFRSFAGYVTTLLEDESRALRAEALI
jgi:sarcosine oxidase subunit gamma